jgi:hypothetical protein
MNSEIFVLICALVGTVAIIKLSEAISPEKPKVFIKQEETENIEEKKEVTKNISTIAPTATPKPLHDTEKHKVAIAQTTDSK